MGPANHDLFAPTSLQVTIRCYMHSVQRQRQRQRAAEVVIKDGVGVESDMHCPAGSRGQATTKSHHQHAVLQHFQQARHGIVKVCRDIRPTALMLFVVRWPCCETMTPQRMPVAMSRSRAMGNIQGSAQ
ncbi:hypothetical protein A1F94_008165 [Pyrenophora tritici-repentis]|uniref:Uncharacterized protein n=1 Tax=Pyrenophora tritici-repentis TaxID=45151 RepID=A0A317AAV7_9PLEO|nr:hypothetical protein PtrV1_06219 [Pyrenophora tritici-repentis]KAF7573615.1 hypothetical protein PtrM4_085200 [Pyrenophora tritici-repentis]KAG9380845.1 hypothetical protein A1F94_008165 [Pyrenophora tritici-repentis]KAI1516107.1 hypothetical protein Ptr86124_004644 [Pyrenophora tritici-repentis]KAI1671643.1 hypothetical protein L13192_05000 [Pyrenophora tritici-repentis]